MDIRCRKTNCKHNKGFTCKAKEIVIATKGDCATFEKDEDLVDKDTSRSMFETPPHYAPQRDIKTLKLICKEKCMFNQNGECIANGITVNVLRETPYCVTYLKKS